MIETLSKMSGTMHVTYKDSKTITQDVGAVVKMTANEAKVSYTMSTVERPVVAYNDFAQIPPCNSIVFRAGDFPIWNRNETALPMSWRLFKNTITNPGKEYTLQTIPSLSTAKDFDVKQNQPNFTLMFEKRVNQAVASTQAMAYYKSVYGLTDDEIQRLDIDVYSDAIMEMAELILLMKFLPHPGVRRRDLHVIGVGHLARHGHQIALGEHTAGVNALLHALRLADHGIVTRGLFDGIVRLRGIRRRRLFRLGVQDLLVGLARRHGGNGRFHQAAVQLRYGLAVLPRRICHVHVRVGQPGWRVKKINMIHPFRNPERVDFLFDN